MLNFKPLHNIIIGFTSLASRVGMQQQDVYLLEGIGRLLCVISTELRVHKVVEREREDETLREIVDALNIIIT